MTSARLECLEFDVCAWRNILTIYDTLKLNCVGSESCTYHLSLAFCTGPTWKGGYWCGYCPWTGMLINVMMMMTYKHDLWNKLGAWKWSFANIPYGNFAISFIGPSKLSLLLFLPFLLKTIFWTVEKISSKTTCQQSQRWSCCRILLYIT